jgi:hypothetical protein
VLGAPIRVHPAKSGLLDGRSLRFAQLALRLKWRHEFGFMGHFPAVRPRRLRQSPALRRLVCETRLSVEQLVLPLFVRSGRKVRRPVAAMPGCFNFLR